MLKYLLIIVVAFFIFACARLPIQESVNDNLSNKDTGITLSAQEKDDNNSIIIVPRDITVKQYFPFLDSIVAQYDTILNYKLTEHILVRTNSWIIDTLVNTDYYRLMQHGVFIYDQRELIVLHKGDTIRIPDAHAAADIQDRIDHTVIDVNIPEFKLRVIEHDTLKYTFTVRVGRNESKYLKTAKRTVSLQTPIGEGEIVRVERNPIFVNPVTGERYTTTKRDDNQYTMMPQIPWLEPAIGGKRLGSLIHPTTNPTTLGKAYSNGCVGTGEGDAWIIYYHSPVSTKVKFRYDLEVINEQGKTIQLRDIYQLKNNKQTGTIMLNAENSIFQFASYSPLMHDHNISECH